MNTILAALISGISGIIAAFILALVPLVVRRQSPVPPGPVAPPSKSKSKILRVISDPVFRAVIGAIIGVILGYFIVVPLVGLLIPPPKAEPPTGFSVITLHPGQVIVNTDIPLTIRGTYSSEGSGLVWVVLEDNIGNYYLQSPPVRFQGGGQWLAENIRPGAGITKVDFVSVTSDGNTTFEGMVAAGDFGAFTSLPPGSQILVTIPIDTSQVSP